MNKLLAFAAILGFAIFSQSCYYDNEESLYPNCDTTNVSYSLQIVPIIENACYRCHSSANANNLGDGILLEGYSNLKNAVNNQGLLGAVKHLDGFEAMPRNASKLSDCNIAKIEAWINAGMLDN